MKTLTPKQREEGYVELEGVLGPDAHLLSFLSGVAHAEKVLGEPSEAEPVAYWDTLNNILVPAVPLVSKRTCFKIEAVPLYLHPAPRRPFVRLSEEQIQEIHSDMYDATTGQWAGMDYFARAIEDALGERNKC